MAEIIFKMKGNLTRCGNDMPPPARGRERQANGPVDLCSEQLSVAKAGVVGTSVKLPSATKKLQPQNETAKLSNYPEITKL